eukprot:CAMPEP_0171916928 /NCGR_PEP_ID=MMETSP0993-20121228/15445_1 /TAXON_ID=483369 /ORGANISM="non described non described, Strain CCMP2098" /LENGTH=158 /DNA_ID=CAMNT_0012552565 /DNA_START=363 /DNA_END=837 /DNA_ORIENTATION=-
MAAEGSGRAGAAAARQVPLLELSEATKGGSGSGGTSVQIAVLRQVLASLQCACRHLTLSLQPSKQRDLAECHYLTARVCAGLAAAITSSSCLQGAAKAPTHTPPPLSGSNEPWGGGSGKSGALTRPRIESVCEGAVPEVACGGVKLLLLLLLLSWGKL